MSKNILLNLFFRFFLQKPPAFSLESVYVTIALMLTSCGNADSSDTHIPADVSTILQRNVITMPLNFKETVMQWYRVVSSFVLDYEWNKYYMEGDEMVIYFCIDNTKYSHGEKVGTVDWWTVWFLTP